MTDSQQIVQAYYDAFNRKDWAGMLALVDENIRHDANQGGQRWGKAAFEAFLEHMDQCYDEQVVDLLIFSRPQHPDRIACEFTIQGVYKATDGDLPEAKGQRYELPVGAFLALKNGKICRVTTYYNLPLWLQLISV